MIKLTVAVLAMIAGLAIQPAMAKVLRGDAFITALQGNTLNGKDAKGDAFNVYFLPGGSATFQGATGKPVAGTWSIDKDGDVCVKWATPSLAEAGCFRVETVGADLTWSNKDGTHHGGLLGEVRPMTVSKRP